MFKRAKQISIWRFQCGLMNKWVYDEFIFIWKKAKKDLKKLLYLCLTEGIHDNR